eukprot:scaffold290849_cov20-Tisochrysis_lutea.AAC.1
MLGANLSIPALRLESALGQITMGQRGLKGVSTEFPEGTAPYIDCFGDATLCELRKAISLRNLRFELEGWHCRPFFPIGKQHEQKQKQ